MAPTLSARRVCWHFTHVLIDTETQLLQATGHVAVDAVLAGSPKVVAQRVEFRTVKCEEPTAYRNKPGSLEELRLSVEHYVREVPADTAGGEGGHQLPEARSDVPRAWWCLHFEHIRK